MNIPDSIRPYGSERSLIGRLAASIVAIHKPGNAIFTSGSAWVFGSPETRRVLPGARNTSG